MIQQVQHPGNRSALETAEEIRALLKTKKVALQFYKADGTKRDMVCLPESEIPESELPTGRGSRTQSPSLVTVYEKDVGFRSFRAQNLISYHVLTPSRPRRSFKDWKREVWPGLSAQIG